jgi:hypothetical protein
MKRHQLILVVCGALMAAVCLGAGWFLFSAMMAKSAAAGERNQNYQELQSLYSAKVFPSAENIARVSEDQKVIEAWLATASNLVHKGELQVEQKSPTVFKQTLQATVRRLSAQPGAVNGKVVAAGFNFGFDKYLGTSDSLPASEHVEQLAQQLTIIELLSKALFSANILSLDAVARETFDEQSAEQSKQEEQPRKRRRRDDSARTQAPAPSAAKDGEYFSKQRFTFEFHARPAAFIEALNRLAALDLFVVVAETEFRKTEDPLAKRTTKKKEGGSPESQAVADPSKLSHVDRIVTDPELEPPVSVKLDIDVYSFKGV